jgi:hypothetical protein
VLVKMVKIVEVPSCQGFMPFLVPFRAGACTLHGSHKQHTLQHALHAEV